MTNYMPTWLGKVIQPDNPSKITSFAKNNYDSFAKIYNACKDESKNINDISVVNSTSDSLSIKIDADSNTLNKIKDTAKDDVNVINDVITA